MIDFEDIDKRLSALRKDRLWLAEAAGYSEAAVREALAPNSKKRSSRLQLALSEAIEKEEARQRDEPAQLSHVTLRITTEELNEWAKAYKNSSVESFEDWTIQAIRNAIREDQEQPENVTQLPPRQPTAHLQAAAGSPIGAEVIDWNNGSDTVMVKINGLSMDPLLDDGEVIPVKLKHACRSHHMAKGEIYLVSYDGGMMVKRYNTRRATADEIAAGIAYTSPTDGKSKVRVLQSVNKDFPEIVIKDEADWIGWYDQKAKK